MSASTDKSRPKLTVAMIVRDEEATLAETLQSVEPIADETIIVDYGSTDRTVEIATKYGAMTTYLPWEQDFSAPRNRGLEMTDGDWVLLLDGGERLTEESAAAIRHIVDDGPDVDKAYRITVRSQSTADDASDEQIAQIRLIPNHDDLRFEGRVRETLEPAIIAAGVGVDLAPGLILTHPRRHEAGWKVDRAKLELELAELEMKEQAITHPRTLLAAGEACAELADDQGADEFFTMAIDAAEHASREMLEAYYGLLTICDNDPAKTGRQLEVCLKALEIFPVDAQLLLAMGNYMQIRDQIDLAIRSFQTAVKHGQVDVATWHLVELGEVAASCLSLCQQRKGAMDDARSTLEEALERYGDAPRLLRHLLDLYAKEGRDEKAVALVERITDDPAQIEQLQLAARGACRAAKKDWTAALGLLQSAYTLGCRDAICMRWLTATLLSNGQLDAAKPVLKEWYSLAPDNAEVLAYLQAVSRPAPPTGAGETDDRQSAESLEGRVFRVDQGTEEISQPQPPVPGGRTAERSDAMQSDKG